MNTNIANLLRASVIAAALSLITVSASASTDTLAKGMSATGYLSVKAAGPYVEVGSYRIWVSSHLGSPSAVLPNGDWSYRGFSVDGSSANGTLVVSFANGRVSQLRLVTPEYLAALRAAPKAGATMAIASR
jgi:hypothetical protein